MIQIFFVEYFVNWGCTGKGKEMGNLTKSCYCWKLLFCLGLTVCCTKFLLKSQFQITLNKFSIFLIVVNIQVKSWKKCILSTTRFYNWKNIQKWGFSTLQIHSRNHKESHQCKSQFEKIHFDSMLHLTLSNTDDHNEL